MNKGQIHYCLYDDNGIKQHEDVLDVENYEIVDNKWKLWDNEKPKEKELVLAYWPNGFANIEGELSVYITTIFYIGKSCHDFLRYVHHFSLEKSVIEKPIYWKYLPKVPE